MDVARVWDLPTRVLHVGLAVSATVAFASGRPVDPDRLHVVAGWTAVALVAGRVAWGFVGERWSRWTHFAAGRPGHTVAAAISTASALALVVALAGTGAVVLGGEEGRGPLAGLVAPSTGVAAHAVHRILAWTGVAWLGVHLAGIARQSWLDGHALPWAMVTGRKPTAAPGVAPRAGAAAVVVVTLAAAVGAAAARPDGPAPARVGAADPAWTRECGDCHLAYPPSLLPAPAWTAMLAPGADHFGESLGLEPAVAAELAAYATTHAAEAGETEHAVRAAAEGAAGPRITATRTWTEAHAAVEPARFEDPAVGGKARCGACHPDAAEGTFDARRAVRSGQTRAAALDAARRSS